MKRKPRDAGDTVGGLELLDESIHVLRTAPASALLAYYTGSVPFVLALLFFWAEMSRSSLAEQRLVNGAIALALLFLWMKTWQSLAAGLIRSHVSREPLAPVTASGVLRILTRQAAVQPASLFLMPLALFILLPFGWWFAFSQNVTVLGARGESSLKRFLGEAWHEAKFAPLQNHLLISVLFFFGFFVFLNLCIGAVATPHLLKSLLGIDTPFTLHIESAFNTTFLAVICGLAYLTIDPLLKTAYTLRCFYSESRRTGEDLRVKLRKAAMTVSLFLLLACPVSAAELPEVPEQAAGASPASAPTTSIQNPPPRSAELNRSISEVLSKPEYAWRSPRVKRKLDPEAGHVKLIERLRNWVNDTSQAISDWFRKVFRGRTPSVNAPFSFFSGKGLVYTLTVVVALAIGVLLYLIWKARWNRREASVDAEMSIVAPDLNDENVTAEQLPEDGWVRLALSLVEQGDLRLALRAFYLASLAHLASRNLVTLARFKSNSDYARELGRRSHALPELTATFAANVATFDRAWYGLHDVTMDMLEEFRLNVERIKSC